VRYELLKRRQFLDDYRELILYFAEANVLAADRFCDSVEAALKMLASHPEIAPKAGFSKVPDPRLWPLRRFPEHVIFR
jgi:plasmid stabilization system protein ParE